MASQFYLVHHHFKPGMAAPWWGEMGKLDEAANEKMAENWLGKGFYNHSFMPVTQEGPMYCVGKLRMVFLNLTSKNSLMDLKASTWE